MSTAHAAAGLEQASATTRHVSSLFRRYWGAFQERRKRLKLRATLCDLNDRELQDICIARGELVPRAGNNRSENRQERRVTLEVLLYGDCRQEIQSAIDGCGRPIQKYENQVQSQGVGRPLPWLLHLAPDAPGLPQGNDRPA
jgi:uncharacterized protein YjiS (DUF1127 family)